MKKLLWVLGLVSILFVSCGEGQKSSKEETKEEGQVEVKSDGLQLSDEKVEEGAVKYLTTAAFKQKVWNYEENPEKWVFKGELPIVIDFYADWCRPCKMVAPIMEELAKKYDGKVNFYKVNTDKERELSSVFQIKSIPSILFVPQHGDPKFSVGAMQKEDYIRAIETEVLGN
jgi:thioredoxin